MSGAISLLLAFLLSEVRHGGCGLLERCLGLFGESGGFSFDFLEQGFKCFNFGFVNFFLFFMFRSLLFLFSNYLFLLFILLCVLAFVRALNL